VAVLDGGRHPLTITVLGLAAAAASTMVAEVRRGIEHHHPQGARGWAVAAGRLLPRNPRRYGGLIAHLGLVLLIVGVALDVTYRTDQRHELTVGESVEAGGYRLTLDRLDSELSSTRMSIAAVLGIERASSGRSVGSLTTERYLGVNQDQPRTRVGVRSLVREDIYVVLEDVSVEDERAGFHVYLHPGVLWLWVGGGLLLLGGTLAIWPFRRRHGSFDPAAAAPRVDDRPRPSPTGQDGAALTDVEARIAARRELMGTGGERRA
jgi:cytochrome c-type biogenesis protein CcmF